MTDNTVSAFEFMGFNFGGRHKDNYDHKDYGGGGYNDHSGHSASGYGGGHKEDEECCPLVVDALCLFAILGAIAGATVFFRQVITIELTGRRRKKRSPLAEEKFAYSGRVNGIFTVFREIS